MKIKKKDLAMLDFAIGSYIDRTEKLEKRIEELENKNKPKRPHKKLDISVGDVVGHYSDGTNITMVVDYIASNNDDSIYHCCCFISDNLFKGEFTKDELVLVKRNKDNV